jgi:hypothetical protein
MISALVSGSIFRQPEQRMVISPANVTITAPKRHYLLRMAPNLFRKANNYG